MPTGTTLTFRVNGTDITSYVDRESIEGRTSLTERLDTLQFTYRDPANTLQVTGKQDVTVTDQSGTNWFGGIVSEVHRLTYSKVRTAEVHAQGYGALLDAAIAKKVYNNQTDAAIVADLISTYRPEISVNVLAPATTLANMSFPYKTVSACLDQLCRATGNKYWVDGTKKLTYIAPAGVTPTLTLTDSNPNGSTTFAYENWECDELAAQLQNRVLVIGASYLQPAITDTFTGDGSTTQFTLEFRTSEIKSITVNGVASVVGHYGLDQYGSGKGVNVLVDDANQLVIFPQAPSAGAAIAVTYTYRRPLLVRLSNGTSYATYGNRWYDGKVSDSTILLAQDAAQRAQTILDQYAFSQYSVKLTTRGPFIRSGGAAVVTNTIDSYGGDMIARTMLVQTNTWHYLGNGLATQDLELIG